MSCFLKGQTRTNHMEWDLGQNLELDLTLGDIGRTSR